MNKPIYEGKPHAPDLKARYQPEISKVIKVIRNKNYAMKTEKTYCQWIARFFYFHQPENAQTLSTEEVHQYLEYLVLKRNVSGHSDVSTTMIYTHVLNTPGLNVTSPADLI